MRIVIDMQGAQTESRLRGIGRYTLSLTRAIARNRGEHEIILALNALFPDTIEPIRAEFCGVLPSHQIRVWNSPGPVRETDITNRARREIAERVREAFLDTLYPDVVLVTSLFEGLGDNAVTSIGALNLKTPVAVILYDLIPLLNPDIHFQTNPVHKHYLARKVSSLKKASGLLAISEYSRQQALQVLGETQLITNISGASDLAFANLYTANEASEGVCRALGITRPFILYTGGADERKNLSRLIEAYALLPSFRPYQLVLAGHMPASRIRELKNAAETANLAPASIIFLGYVSDAELVALYRQCALFVFPSLQEGFGLPPLEAMACGAPVIAANATSLPEVVGLPAALFDPTSVKAIQEKMLSALTDSAFRAQLIAHGLTQARRFSWDNSAKAAVRALEALTLPTTVPPSSRVRTYRAAPPPPEFFRILVLKLDHMGDFLLALPALAMLRAKYPYAEIDALVGSWNQDQAHITKYFRHIFTLDFFKQASVDAPFVSDADIAATISHLGEYDLALDLRRQPDTRFILMQINARVKAGYETFDRGIDGALTVRIPSERDVPFVSTNLNKTSIEQQMAALVRALPHCSSLYNVNHARFMANATSVRNVAVGLFPFAGNDVKEWGTEKFRALANDLLSRKQEVSAVHVFVLSETQKRDLCLEKHDRLVWHVGLSVSSLEQELKNLSVCVTNNSYGAHVAVKMGVLVVGIYGGQETVAEWAPVAPWSYAIYTKVECSPCHIARRLDCPHNMLCFSEISVGLVRDCVLAACWHTQNRTRANSELPPFRLIRDADDIMAELVASLPKSSLMQLSEQELQDLAADIAHIFTPDGRVTHIFVDISTIVEADSRTGIQRIVRALLQVWLTRTWGDFRVEPVYAVPGRCGYRYARRWTMAFLGAAQEGVEDDWVDIYPGDVFISLDLNHTVPREHEGLYQQWRNRGVGVYFVVYDLLPVRLPHCFPPEAEAAHTDWLAVVAQVDGALCISQTVADDLRAWLDEQSTKARPSLQVTAFPMGHDIENSVPTRGLPEEAGQTMAHLAARPSFLMVGTVEPRKGHAQALAAFEQLWALGLDVNLAIVGKQGWMVESLVDNLRGHKENGQRLFWLEGISDEYLERVYNIAAGLIAASEGEGFGLPLIEAARHGLPIIARDIPVFREVAGPYATYFANTLQPASIADTVQEWLVLSKDDARLAAHRIPRATWEDSARTILEIVGLLPPPAVDRDAGIADSAA